MIKFIKRFLVAMVALAYAAGLILIAVSYKSGLGQAAGWKAAAAVLSEKQATLSARNAQTLVKKMQAMKPVGLYIVIDTGANRLYLKEGDRVIREAVISCGSGEVLKDPKDPAGKKQWIFDTPRGEFAVHAKIKNPYWVKPDWAFIEDDEPIPAKDAEERFEAGTLGDYALSIGEGYFIHGTLYTRLLGRNVTHGCVRMGDEDLEYVFKAVQIGTKVYIY